MMTGSSGEHLSLKKASPGRTAPEDQVPLQARCHFGSNRTLSEEVASVMSKYNLVVLPVVDSIGRLMGRITIDDIVDVIQEEAERDYQMASGISADVEPGDSAWMMTRARLPWLLIGLLGGILVALVISRFEGDIKINPQVAFFIPLIAAMAGNVGIQSSAIIVQSIAANITGH